MRNLAVRLVLVAAVVSMIVPSVPAGAELCTIDTIPASSLLLPYFEVDLSKKRRVNTVFSIANVDAAAAIAHVTLWTNWASATLAFDVFLTGYDVQTVDLGALLREGVIPVTAHARRDPGDSISPHGGIHSNNPTWDSRPDFDLAPDFLGCDALLPPAPLGDTQLDRLRNAHTGRDTGVGCVGADLGDDVARGYVTIDHVNDCTLLFPGEGDYLSGPTSYLNVLWGEYRYAQKGGALAIQPLVAIEANEFGVATYGFYGRYGGDIREPLATTWAMRRLGPKLEFGKKEKPIDTDVVIWRDTRDVNVNPTYACGAAPAWFPLQETQVVVFDEQEDIVEVCSVGVTTDPACAPLATQRLRLGQGDLVSPILEGWWYWNLNQGGDLIQSHVSTLVVQKDRVRAGSPATALTTACY